MLFCTRCNQLLVCWWNILAQNTKNFSSNSEKKNSFFFKKETNNTSANVELNYGKAAEMFCSKSEWFPIKLRGKTVFRFFHTKLPKTGSSRHVECSSENTAEKYLSEVCKIFPQLRDKRLKETHCPKTFPKCSSAFVKSSSQITSETVKLQKSFGHSWKKETIENTFRLIVSVYCSGSLESKFKNTCWFNCVRALCLSC